MFFAFDMGGTLMEYSDMPRSWSQYYINGFRAINHRYFCGASEADIQCAAAVLQAWNPRLTGRQEELTPTFLFGQALASWSKQPPISEAVIAFFASMNLRPKIYSDSIPCLTNLHQLGHHIAALTDLPNGMPDEVFKNDIRDLLPFIDFYLSSAVCGVRKPNAKGLHWIAHNFSVPVEEIIFLGDEDKDRQTAANAGCRFVLVERSAPKCGGLLKALRQVDERVGNWDRSFERYFTGGSG